jgi:hypothetical protein
LEKLWDGLIYYTFDLRPCDPIERISNKDCLLYCEKAQQNNTNRKSKVAITGIREESLYSELKYFNFENDLSYDPMHSLKVWLRLSWTASQDIAFVRTMQKC